MAKALRRASSGSLAKAWEALLPAAELFPREPWVPYNLACYAAQFSRLDEAWEWLCRSLAICADKEALKILQRMEDSEETPTHKTIYEPGEMVRVIDGPFNDFTGSVEEVNYEKSRLRVAVLIFGRSTPVELEFGQVEKS